MTEDSEKQRSKPWQWPGQWVRDQNFYRDIATRTASGLAVVSITYLFAVFMGYIGNPGVWHGVLAFVGSVGVTGGIGLIAGFGAALISWSFHRIVRKSNRELQEAIEKYGKKEEV